MESDNEEDGVVSYRNKYRQLKSRLKYLIYVSNVANEWMREVHDLTKCIYRRE